MNARTRVDNSIAMASQNNILAPEFAKWVSLPFRFQTDFFLFSAALIRFHKLLAWSALSFSTGAGL